VQGVDLWLNTPRRPMEASGTSGMKAAFNGAPNLSILDGWWDEAHSSRTGWAIGAGEAYEDLGYQDRVEADTLYDLLEREVIPLFYDRSSTGLPKGWIALMKSAMADLCPVFNTNRMVQEYTAKAYHPARDRHARLMRDGFRRARELAAWRARVRKAWAEVQVSRVELEVPEEVRVGDELEVRARVRLGKLDPAELSVQAFLGRVDQHQQIIGGEVIAMECVERGTDDEALFRARVRCGATGLQGVTVRILAHHEDLAHPHCANVIRWAQ
jgi:starch phosphorylase